MCTHSQRQITLTAKDEPAIRASESLRFTWCHFVCVIKSGGGGGEKKWSIGNCNFPLTDLIAEIWEVAPSLRRSQRVIRKSFKI